MQRICDRDMTSLTCARRWSERQTEGNGGAGAFAACDPNRAAMRVHQAFGDVEPDANSSNPAGILRTEIGAEDILTVGFRNTDALVLELDDGGAVLLMADQRDRLVRPRVFERIGQNILKHL